MGILTSRSKMSAPAPADNVQVPVKTENGEAPPPGSSPDCGANYQSSFGPYCELFKNPMGEFSGGMGGLFSISHDSAETHLQAFSFWCIVKMYTVIAREFFRFILVGIVIGFIGGAILNMILGLLFGFLFSHLFWFLVTYQKGCCGPPGYVIMAVLCFVGVILGIVSLADHAILWDFWPEYIGVDILEMVSMVPSIFQGINLVTLFQRENGQQNEGVVVA